MASVVYPKYKEALLTGSANTSLTTGTVKAALVDTGTYTYNAAHDFYDDVTGVVGTPQTIANKTVVNGLFDGDNVTYTGLTGSSAEAIIIYIDTGSAATSRLAVYIDSATGLPVTPNSGDVAISWNASGIFQL